MPNETHAARRKCLTKGSLENTLELIMNNATIIACRKVNLLRKQLCVSVISGGIPMKHVFCDCICIRKVLGFRVIHAGLPPQAAQVATEAAESGRVTPSRR